MTKQRNFYTREFKLAILSQVEAGVPVAQVARENGLHPALVARWKKEFLEDPEKAFSGPGHPYKDQARVAELERMVGKLYAKICSSVVHQFLHREFVHWPIGTFI